MLRSHLNGPLIWKFDLRTWQLVVGVVLQLSMQLTGIDVIFYYSTLVLRQATVTDPPLATVLLGGLNVVMMLVAVATMEQAPRRPVLLTSWGGLCVSHMLLACSQIGIEVASLDEGAMRVLSLLGMAGVVVCFALGPGCVAWYVVAEIFPMHARDAAFSLGLGLNWAANWLVAFAFPLVQRALGPYTFLIFACSSAGFGLFTWACVPETRKRSMTQVLAEFDQL